MNAVVPLVLVAAIAIGGRMVVWGLEERDRDLQHWIAAAAGGVLFAAAVAALAERTL